MNKLQRFLDTATPREIGYVAKVAKTTPAYLANLAKQYGTGRCPNVMLAIGIENATREVRRRNHNRTPLVKITDVGALCEVAYKK